MTKLIINNTNTDTKIKGMGKKLEQPHRLKYFDSYSLTTSNTYTLIHSL